MKYLWHIRWLTPLVLIGCVLWQAIVATGSLQAITDFRERTPYFDVLLPAGRVERTDRGVVLKQEPVYVDVRLPVRAKSMALELKVAAGSSPIKLGWQSDDNFTLAFNGSEPVESDNIILYHYDLDDINYVRPGHKGRFIISSPGLMSGSVIVTGASVSFRREPPSLNWFKQQFSKLIW